MPEAPRDRHRLRVAAPGLGVQPHGTVELYPRAGVLTAWFNAAQAARTALALPPALPRVPRADDAFHGEEAELSAWPLARLELVPALDSLMRHLWASGVDAGPARCVLPVPGDPAGLPPGAARAAAAGQAMLVPITDGALVVSPTIAADGSAVWHAQRAPQAAPWAPDVRAARLEINELLATAIAAIEDAALPAANGDLAQRRVAALAAPPLPPGSSADAVALARSSATLVAVVESALTAFDPAGSARAQLAALLVPLGAAGRRALATALSATVTARPGRYPERP